MLAKLYHGDFAESKSGFRTSSTPFSSMCFISLDKDYKVPSSVAGKLSKAFIEILKQKMRWQKALKKTLSEAMS